MGKQAVTYDKTSRSLYAECVSKTRTRFFNSNNYLNRLEGFSDDPQAA